MIILTLRTDKPEAELGLFDDTQQLAYDTWLAHRALSTTLHAHIAQLLAGQGKTLADLQGIVAFAGPGSFTGLRIGLTVANSMAYGLSLPIVGISGEEQWIQKGIARHLAGTTDPIVMPAYGSEAHITVQKK